MGRFSPRKRRCFWKAQKSVQRNQVFSAQAEVFPAYSRMLLIKGCFLRASGGVSKEIKVRIEKEAFSPRKRRCFFIKKIQKWGKFVFSAQAEVFL